MTIPPYVMLMVWSACAVNQVTDQVIVQACVCGRLTGYQEEFCLTDGLIISVFFGPQTFPRIHLVDCRLLSIRLSFGIVHPDLDL